MKHSVRGKLGIKNTSDKDAVVNDINKYLLWHLITEEITNDTGGTDFTFEAWVESATNKDSLFADMKKHVDILGGETDWHECTHDEHDKKPCVIKEKYSK